MTVKTFISRPLLSIVISVFIVLLGVISLLSLPVEKYPDIAPPTINVWASYPGASAETVQKSVVTPLEEAINGVEGMTYMKSSASNGSGSVTVFFEQGANADMAAVNVQNRVIQAQGQLPAEVLQIGVSTEKQQPGQLRIIALESPGGTYDENFLSNYFYNNLRPAILRINGVGKVEVWGAQYALRIWLKPDVMARHNLMPSDISAVLAEQNIEVSVGALGENSDNVFQYALRYTGRKTEISEFEDLVITSLPTGEELRLKDVADIELGQSDYAFTNRINGHPGVMGAVHQVAGSNATKINLEIDKLISDVEQSVPKDIKIVTFDNTNDFLFASIREVVVTLIIAILLVLVVVFFFLQDFRATLIPAIGIVVSLIGTFAFMKVAGFSVNLLTLFALVLVIGTVVDDSIVVVEAVKTNFDSGYKSAYQASVDAMKGLAVTLFTTTLVFMLDQQYAVTEECIRVQEENLRVLRAMKEVGQQTAAAVNQAEANYQSVVASLPMLEAQIRKAESALCLLLNRQPETIARASWSAVRGAVMDTERAIPLEALSARPDVLAAEYQLRASFSNVKVARCAVAADDRLARKATELYQSI